MMPKSKWLNKHSNILEKGCVVMSNEKLIQAYFKNVNEENLTELLELFVEDGEFKAPGMSLLRGKEIGKFYQNIFEYPKHIDYPILIIEEGDNAAVKIRAEVKTKSGAETELYAVDIFEFENGKIKKLNVFFDNYEIMKNLGLLNRKA